MKATLLKHYGKILLTILALGVGSYLHLDVSKLIALFDTTTPVPVAGPAAAGSDAGL